MTAIATQVEVAKALQMEVKIYHCGVCHVELTRIVRLCFVTDEKTNQQHVIETQNYSAVCTQKGCVMYIDLSKVNTWRRKNG